MYIEQINLTPDGRVHLTAYLHHVSAEMPERSLRPAMLILPGGGYGMTSDREAEPIALAFAARGFNAFVLRYSVGEHARYPAPQTEAFRALMMIRKNAEQWNVYPHKVAVCGFSAGGHLAATTAVLWKHPDICGALGTSGGEIRPDAVILSYAVIDSGAFAHRGSFDLLLGPDPSPQAADAASPLKHVDAQTPPVFLWHTADDAAVPVENALMMASALRKSGVPFELHIYNAGPHGLSLCTEETGMVRERCAGWTDLASGWLKETLG